MKQKKKKNYTENVQYLVLGITKKMGAYVNLNEKS